MNRRDFITLAAGVSIFIPKFSSSGQLWKPARRDWEIALLSEGTEVSGYGYARRSGLWSDFTNDTLNKSITFPTATGSWGLIDSAKLITKGKVYHINLTVPQRVFARNLPTFTPGSLLLG